MQPKFAESNQDFTTGAKRGSQAGKPRPDLTSPYARLRKGIVSAHGAEHYGDRNWEKGMPFSRVVASMERHLMSYLMGDTSEDHLAQLGWNVDALLHFEEMVKRGLLPKELDDLPKYEQQVFSDLLATTIAPREHWEKGAEATEGVQIIDRGDGQVTFGKPVQDITAYMERRREEAQGEVYENLLGVRDGRPTVGEWNALEDKFWAAEDRFYNFIARQVRKIRRAIANTLTSLAFKVDPNTGENDD